MNGPLYDDRPALSRVPLSPEEVDTLLTTDGSYFTRDSHRVRHLLTRMRAAFEVHRGQMRSLQRDVEQISAASANKRSPVSAAVAALRLLSLAEQEQVFDIRARVLVDAVRTAQADAERARMAATSEANRTRFALAKVMDDPQISAEVRAKIVDALAFLPERPTGVDVQTPTLPSTDGAFSVPPADSAESLSAALFGQE